MGMIIRGSVRKSLTVDDLNPGDVFIFNGDDKIYMMTDYDGWFVHLPSGNLIDDGYHIDCDNRPVVTINVELMVK